MELASGSGSWIGCEEENRACLGVGKPLAGYFGGCCVGVFSVLRSRAGPPDPFLARFLVSRKLNAPIGIRFAVTSPQAERRDTLCLALYLDLFFKTDEKFSFGPSLILAVNSYYEHRSYNQTGRFTNKPITCYFCAKMGHTKARCFRFKRFIASRFRTRIDPPKVKQIWVRKDLVSQVRPMGRDTTYRHLAPILVVKKHVLPNPVKPPLVDRVSLAY